MDVTEFFTDIIENTNVHATTNRLFWASTSFASRQAWKTFIPVNIHLRACVCVYSSR